MAMRNFILAILVSAPALGADFIQLAVQGDSYSGQAPGRSTNVVIKAGYVATVAGFSTGTFNNGPDGPARVTFAAGVGNWTMTFPLQASGAVLGPATVHLEVWGGTALAVLRLEPVATLVPVLEYSTNLVAWSVATGALPGAQNGFWRVRLVPGGK